MSDIDTIADAARWHLAFVLLGSARVDALWPDMGAELVAPHAHRDLARHAVRAYREVENDPVLTTEQRLARYRAMFAFASSAMGQPDGTRFGQWIRDDFPYESELEAQLFLWRPLLARAAELENPQQPLVPLPFDEETNERLRARIAGRIQQLNGAMQRLEEAERAPKDEWDTWVQKTYGADIRVTDWVAAALRFHFLRTLWREIEEVLGENGLQQLLVWARRQAALKQMPAELIELPDLHRR